MKSRLERSDLMERASNRLRSYQGANPFHEAQAKTFAEDKLVGEFFPTSTFLSLFNEQHEVLIGSRGSGKTALLRMLSYSCLHAIKNPDTKSLIADKRFIGFYIPLHIEWMASLPQVEADGTGSTEYFQFAFNCKAAQALLSELKTLIRDLSESALGRLDKEGLVLTRLSRLWLDTDAANFSTLEDLSWEIECLYNKLLPWRDGSRTDLPFFAKHLFAPVLSALPHISRDLGLDPDKTHWIACVDEAEFLKPAYIKCFNSFMRSDKRPIVLKLATMPFKYTTRETLVPGILAEANGNDFNFRPIDLSWDSRDSFLLSNHLVDRRLKRLGMFSGPVTLDDFVGRLGDDDPKDYYRAEIGEDSSDEAILAGILESISAERRKRFEAVKDDPSRVQSDYFKRFSPVYYVRRMKFENSRGNRSVGWFAGPAMIRRIADGNPRRFIQIMHDLFESARAAELTAKEQHRVLVDFVEREYPRSAGLPDYGPLLKGILDTLGELMAQRVHGKTMIDGGTSFAVHPALLHNAVVRGALELGIAYSYLFVDAKSLLDGLTEESDFTIAHLVAVKFWIPMRKGERLLLKSPHAKDRLLQQPKRAPATLKESDTVIGGLQLQLFSAGPSDDVNS
jgi:hypothetical protein